MWPVLLAKLWTHYEIGKLHKWTLFCNVCMDILNSQIWKQIKLELNSLQVVPSSQLIFPSKTWFFEIYLNFQWQKSLKNHYLPHSESKSYQINSINTKGTFQFLWKFQLWFNLIFSEEIIQYSRTLPLQVQMLWNQAHAPLLIESFPKTPRTQSDASWFDGSHNYKTKQTTFLHRYMLTRYPLPMH